ncbi:hypothetical protein O3M35_005624 [Rhynocoris fuscipes]|uniref:Uncharacterized protein n=1 Tax=Rhynocoris fuscipes TaxID=488301 RepID=A0AAW1DMK8_9HEMI
MIKKIMMWLLANYFLTRYLVFNDDAATPTCVCAIMNQSSIEPLIEQEFPNKMGCDETGKLACRKLCTTLAEVTKQSGNGAQILCQQLMRDAIVTVNLFSKVCDAPFEHTGIQYEKPVCCENGSVCNVTTTQS